MPEYRRSYIEGGTYFFAVVTYNRLPILATDAARVLLRSAWMDVRKRFPLRYGRDPRRFPLEKRRGSHLAAAFWEPTVCDQDALNHPIDYLHYNLNGFGEV